MNRCTFTHRSLSAAAGLLLVISSLSPAVTSVLTRHSQSRDFLKGETDHLVIDSDGTLRLSRQTHPVDLGAIADRIWTINSMLPTGNGYYLGTSPNGIILKQTGETTETVYPADDNAAAGAPGAIRNQHVFTMAHDVAGRLLAGVSGDKGKLIRMGEPTETLFESETDKYIFAIVLDDDGFIYLGTGPEGNIYRLPAFGGEAEKIYHTKDKNVLTLAFAPDGALLAGTDSRGLVYKIDVQKKTAQVIFNSEKAEVTALTTDEAGNVYAAVSSAAVHSGQIDSVAAALAKQPGRPDVETKSAPGNDSVSLQTANAASGDGRNNENNVKPPSPPSMAPGEKGGIYRISPDGFSKEIFSEKAIFYSLAWQNGKLLAATGSQGRAYSIDPETQQRAILYEDEKSAQITSIVPLGEDLLLALSNPAKVIRLSGELAQTGTYESELIDASQPARWGKLQLAADIPAGSQVTMSCRSGNVDEPNDPTFSAWTPEVAVSSPVDMQCPVARYAQYRLTFVSPDGATSPVVREVAAAYSVPNLAPQVESVEFQRNKAPKTNVFKVVVKTQDENSDEMVYHLDFRRTGRSGWIRAEENADKAQFEWDTQTVEDGRYELRVTADDRPSNSPDQALSGSRVSDVVVVDNTPPRILNADLSVNGKSLTLKFQAVDAFSAIGKVQYTIDSDDNWSGALPADYIFDTLEEAIVLKLDKLEPGDHVLAVAVSDDPGNTRYQTFTFTVSD